MKNRKLLIHPTSQHDFASAMRNVNAELGTGGYSDISYTHGKKVQYRCLKCEILIKIHETDRFDSRDVNQSFKDCD
jgi:hypothetical protein